MKRISGEEIARIWNGDNDSGSEHDEAPANMIDFLPADEAQAEIDLLNKRIDELEKDCSTLISVKNKQQVEIDRLIETIETGDCWVSSFISSVCDKGTKGCIAKHKGE